MNKWKLNNKEKQENTTHTSFISSFYFYVFLCMYGCILCIFLFFCFLVTGLLYPPAHSPGASIQMHETYHALTKSRHFLFEPQVGRYARLDSWTAIMLRRVSMGSQKLALLVWMLVAHLWLNAWYDNFCGPFLGGCWCYESLS